MTAVTDGEGRGEGSGMGEWQGPSIVLEQCESVSIAIETGATLGRHAFISTTGSPLAIRGQINPPGCSVCVCRGYHAGAHSHYVYLLYLALALLQIDFAALLTTTTFPKHQSLNTVRA